MLAVKHVNLQRILVWSVFHILWLTLWSAAVVSGMHWMRLDNWLHVPWLPISLVGTAVAFFVGFKNNSSYGRLWEARKIWGGIVNSSRTLGISIRAFVSNQSASENLDEEALGVIHRRILLRHIAWLYTLRNQLLVVKPWEHAGQKGSSSPGESHPQALTEPDVNLSAHPAPIVLSQDEFRFAIARTSWVLGGQLALTNEPLSGHGERIA